jgi:hypothetical protein
MPPGEPGSNQAPLNTAPAERHLSLARLLRKALGEPARGFLLRHKKNRPLRGGINAEA